MSKHEWSELDYVAGAAHAMHMSYGSFVAAGMPNLERFKRAVEQGEILTIQKGRRGGGVNAALKSMKLPLKPKMDKPKTSKPKVDRREERKNLVCAMCGVSFKTAVKAGSLPMYCPACKEERRRMQKRADCKRYRERKKAGEQLA